MPDDVLYPPMPQPDELTTPFWDGVEQGKLVIARCDACGTYVHPPKSTCYACLGTAFTPTEVSGRATLVTWTQPNQPFDPYYQAHMPYVLAVVNLVEQEPLRVITNIVDCDEADLRIDLPVEVTFREVAPGCTLPLFRPAS